MNFSTKFATENGNSVANFFHTFGFLVINDFIVSTEKRIALINLINQTLSIRRSLTLQEIPVNTGIFEGGVVGELPELFHLLLSKSTQTLVSKLLGEKWLYLGSDLSVFSPFQAQPWHRDWVTHLPILKVGVYLNTATEIGGELRVIPSSHHISSPLSRGLNKALAWPKPPVNLGGLNENQYFPQNHNYGNHPVDGNYAHLTKDTADQKLESKIFTIPHVAIPLTNEFQGIFFDPRSVHSGTIGLPLVQRVMISMLFCPNPYDESFSFGSFGITQDKMLLATELLELLAIDRMFHKQKNTYGREGPNIYNFLDSDHTFEIDLDNPESLSASFGKLASLKIPRRHELHPESGRGELLDLINKLKVECA